MTNVVARWRVGYAPGEWLCLSGPTSVVLVDPSGAELPEIEVLWADVVRAASMEELVGRLGALGRSRVPRLAALFWGPGGMRSLVRGPIVLRDTAGGQVLAEAAADVVTWRESALADVTDVTVELTTQDQGAPVAALLPMVVGAARVGALRLRVEQVNSPQGDSGIFGTVPTFADGETDADLVGVPTDEGVDDPHEHADADDADADAEPLAEADSHPGAEADGFPGADADPDPNAGADDGADPGDPSLPLVSGGVAAGAVVPAGAGAVLPPALASSSALSSTSPEPEPADASTAADASTTADAVSPAAAARSGAAGDEGAATLEDEAARDDDGAATEEQSAEDLFGPETAAVQESAAEAPAAGATDATELMAVVGDPDATAPALPLTPHAGPTVAAALCDNGHPNPPYADGCWVCGSAVPPQEPRSVPRPVLGRLRVQDGTTMDLDRAVVIGRAPSLSAAPDGVGRLLTVPSPSHDISRTHVLVVPEGWQILVTDLQSTNGTTVVTPGPGVDRVVLQAGQPLSVAVGTLIELGDGVSVLIDAAQ